MSFSIPYLSTAHLGGVGEWGLCDDDDLLPIPIPTVPTSSNSVSSKSICKIETKKKSEDSPVQKSSRKLNPSSSTRKDVANAARTQRADGGPLSAPATSKRPGARKSSLVDEELFMQVMGSPDRTISKTPTRLGKLAPSRQSMAGIKADLRDRTSQLSVTSETSLWVEEYLQTACLQWALSLFSELDFSLELVPFLESKQVDDILAHSRVQDRNNGDFADLDLIVEKVKLVCALRAMRVHLEAAGRMKALETLEPKNISGSSPLMVSTDVKSWTVEMVSDWLASVPVLKHLQGLFRSNNIDGHALLRLHERKLQQQLKIGSPVDRRLLLQHISDLSALQISSTLVPIDTVQKLPTESLGTHSRRSTRHRERESVPIAHSTPEHPKMKPSYSVPASPSIAAPSDDKKTPNFFISLRIDNKEIQQTVRDLQEEIMNHIPVLRGSKCILDPALLHFTVGRLVLSSPEDEKRAQEILQEASRIYERIYSQRSVAITFRSIANHGGNAVFVETEFGQERDDLTEFGNTVFELFKDAGLASRNFRFQPVAPIIRIHSNKKEAVAPLKEYFVNTLMPRFEDKILGRHVFSSIEISSVSPEHNSGYYDSLASCSWTH